MTRNKKIETTEENIENQDTENQNIENQDTENQNIENQDTENKQRGRKKLTDEDKQSKYALYKKRMVKRNKTPVSFDKWENKNMPTGEDKKELFVRLTKQRMPKTIKQIRNVAYLSRYEFTEEQKNKIIADLQKAVDEVKINFAIKSNEEIKEYVI